VPLVMDALALDYESLTHFTPTLSQRKSLAKSGIAMPDGSFYIRNAQELDDAIRAVGRATPNAGESDVARRNSVRRHIIQRAKALNLESKIPDTWNSDGSLKQSGMTEELLGEVDNVIQHFGRKGMKWGQHRFGRDRGTTSGRHPVSTDALTARSHMSTVRKHGTAALSNHELRALNDRLNLESQFRSLTQKDIDAGKSEVNRFLGEQGKRAVSSISNEIINRGSQAIVKQLAKKAGL
jgi:hypothetical protein